MRRLLLVLLVCGLPLTAEMFTETAAATKVTLLHFSDYHSHALPFYTDDGERGGIARAIRFLRSEKRAGTLVFSGGDSMNKGAPAWSDEFRCAEWSWLNGVVDAMAFGNHDVDYGRAELDRCRKSITYPILSANTEGFPGRAVFEAGGARIGVFALAGPDFEQLGVATLLADSDANGSPFSDSIAAARREVRFLREVEKVDAVVLIGHQHQEEDYKLAREVPGIDVIFGSHSHLKRDLTQIEGTQTSFISPSQYLSLISRVELTIQEGKVTSVRGGLIPVDGAMKEDRGIARRVRRMQRRLENDPEHRALFLPIATLPAPVSTDALARLALETMRTVADADLAISTTSSFRRPLPAGRLNLELLRGAMPYDNEIVTCSMSGAQWQELVRTAGAESYMAAPGVLDPARGYTVVSTDYMAFVAYKDVFACEKKRTGLRVRDELRKHLVRSLSGAPTSFFRPPDN